MTGFRPAIVIAAIVVVALAAWMLFGGSSRDLVEPVSAAAIGDGIGYRRRTGNGHADGHAPTAALVT